jgi:ribose 5-phosphate isomerase B
MIYLAADHNGYLLKEGIKKFLVKSRINFFDMGPRKKIQSDDYPDYAKKLGRALKKDDLGILICGSGHGMAISANKLRGVRAILALDARSAEWGRRDDHANVLALAAWQTKSEPAEKIVSAFLRTRPGADSRYLRRLKKILALEA